MNSDSFINRKYNGKREGLQDASAHPKLLQINVIVTKAWLFWIKVPTNMQEEA